MPNEVLPALNSQEMRDTLVQQNLALASFAVGKALRSSNWWHVFRVDPGDMLTEAYIALCRAADLWDPKLGTFSTYAMKCMGYRLSNYVRGFGTGIEREGPLLSLDEPVTRESDLHFGDCLEDDGPLPESMVEEMWVRERLDWALGLLQPRERGIVTGHLDGYTDPEMAEWYGISRQLVHALRHEAYHRMRWHLRTDPEFVEWVEAVFG